MILKITNVKVRFEITLHILFNWRLFLDNIKDYIFEHEWTNGWDFLHFQYEFKGTRARQRVCEIFNVFCVPFFQWNDANGIGTTVFEQTYISSSRPSFVKKHLSSNTVRARFLFCSGKNRLLWVSLSKRWANSVADQRTGATYLRGGRPVFLVLLYVIRMFTLARASILTVLLGPSTGRWFVQIGSFLYFFIQH